MEQIWTELYNSAKSKINTKEIKPFIEYGNNSCAVLSQSNKIYTGISITSTTAINSNAEKSAITTMLNNGELGLKKMVILNELEEVLLPTEECLEYLLEMNANPDEIEILADYEHEKIIKLSETIPDWWGTYRNIKK